MKKFTKDEIIGKVFGYTEDGGMMPPVTANNTTQTVKTATNSNPAEQKFYSGSAWNKAQLQDVITQLSEFTKLSQDLNSDRSLIGDGTLAALISQLTTTATSLVDACDKIQKTVSPNGPVNPNHVDPTPVKKPEPTAQTTPVTNQQQNNVSTGA